MNHFPRFRAASGLVMILATATACGRAPAPTEPSHGKTGTLDREHVSADPTSTEGRTVSPGKDVAGSPELAPTPTGAGGYRDKGVDAPTTRPSPEPPPPVTAAAPAPTGGPTSPSKVVISSSKIVIAEPSKRAPTSPAPPTAKPAGKKTDASRPMDEVFGTGAVGTTSVGAGAVAGAPAPVAVGPKVPTPPIPRPVETLPPISLDQESKTGGILTAAIWDDNKFRDEFATFLNRYPSYKAEWGLEMGRRVVLRVEDSAGVLVGDAALSMRTPDGQVINLRTHGDGTTYYFPGAVPAAYFGPNGPTKTAGYAVAAQVGTLRTETVFAAPVGDTNTWTLKLPGVPVRSALPALDVAIVLDTTGSMGDEIGYIQREVEVVIKRAKIIHGMRRLRLGLVLYKDRGDEYVTKTFPFTEDVATFNSNLRFASSGGGGDTPESVNEALSDTVKKLAWAGDETGRLAILIADAPPHFYPDETYTYKNALVDLNSRGIKLITLGASGIDKSCEYLFRQMSAYTGSRYVFLTDDSGVGGSHILPDISGYQVERLDRIMVRVISDEAKSFDRK